MSWSGWDRSAMIWLRTGCLTQNKDCGVHILHRIRQTSVPGVSSGWKSAHCRKVKNKKVFALLLKMWDKTHTHINPVSSTDSPSQLQKLSPLISLTAQGNS